MSTVDNPTAQGVQAEQRIRRLNSLYEALSRTNNAILHASERDALFREVCRIAVECGRLKMAWIGLVEAESGRVRLVASHGPMGPFLTTIRVSVDASLPEGRGATGQAIREARPVVYSDFTSDPVSTPWRKALDRMGCRALAALPIAENGTVVGALVVYSEEVGYFDEELTGLLAQMAADLSHALDNLRRESERRAAQAALEQSEARFRAIVDQAAVGIAQAGPDGRIVLANQQFCDLLGYDEAELEDLTCWDLGHPQDAERREFTHCRMACGEVSACDLERQLQRKDGAKVWVRLTTSVVRGSSGEARHFIVVVQDISERKRSEARLTYLAHYDNLTGLPNRTLFRERVDHALVQAKRHGWTCGVLLLDLRRFKQINDTLGHAAGDRLLQEVAARLLARLRADDTVARLGGDEFAVVLSSLANPADARSVAGKLLDCLGQPFQLEGDEVYVTANIGIALFPSDGEDAETLLRNANAAMYRAKELGCNACQYYAAEMNGQAMARLRIENDLRRALERGEFTLHYQPRVSCGSGTPTGVEALLRWQHPTLGTVPPGDFVPLLEETGLILQVGEWVLETACAQAKAWQDAGLPALSMAVNLSPRQFQHADLIDAVQRVLGKTGLPAAFLELEITEGSLMHDVEQAAATLRGLKALGVRLALDDFGTGYSSLNYLKRFPLDALKIDRSFISDIANDPDDSAIVLAVINIAHSLSLTVVAEGVETEAQLAFLSAHQCDEIQGYYFSRPLPAQECTALIAARRRMALPARVAPSRERTVLLVDDEENILAALKRLLRRDGYRLLTATSAEQGLALLAAHNVGVIISDQRMPGMNGTEFLRRVKALHPNTVRIVLSGYTELQSVADAINEGAIYKFLTKPWNDEQLRAHIADAFRHLELARENERLSQAIMAANAELTRVNTELQGILAEKSVEMQHSGRVLQIAQEALQELPLPVIGIDPEGMVVLTNSSAETLLRNGLPALGAYADEILPADLLHHCANGACAAKGEADVAGRRFRVLSHRMGRSSGSEGTVLVLLPEGGLAQ